MKKIAKILSLKVVVLFLFSLLSFISIGQSGNISNTTLNTCDYTLYDDGGPSGDYSETNYQMTICASAGNDLYFYIDQLALGTAFNGDSDILIIYEGTGTTGAVLFDSQVNSAPSGILLTTNTCVTVFLDTDPVFFSTDVGAGFEIVFSCTLPETCSDGILNNGEVMIDCGGVNCEPCFVPTACEPNVVNNGDFETSTVVCGSAVNTGYGTSNQIPRPWYDQTPVQDWWGTAIRIDDNISFPSPDYHNSSCTNAGSVNCMSGSGSVGFFTHFSGGTGREYIQTMLNTPLDAGEEYCISVRVGAKRGNSDQVPTDKLGFWFHNNVYSNGSGFAEYENDNGGNTFMGPGTPVNGTPQVVNPAGNMITPVCSEFNYSFCPAGGETHLMIGNFTPGNSDSGSSEYISIDDLVITKSCPLDFDSDITASGTPDCVGSCVDLTANAYNQSGGCEVTNDFTFQWFENGVLMPGETLATLTSVCPTSTTTYSVEITYSAGCKTMTKPENQTTITFNCGGCTPPTLVIDNLFACDPNTVDLNNAINPASDPGNATFYSSSTDANNATNSISNTVSVSGTYYIRLENLGDPSCFTVEAVTVTITPSYNLNENISACQNTVITYPDGSTATITANTTYTSNLVTTTGCDSIIVSTVTMLNAYNLTENFTVCSGSNFTYPDGTVSSNIVANESHVSNLTTTAGCDSVITTNVTVGSAFTSTNNVAICSGDNFTYPDGTVSNNVTVNESHVSQFVAVGGCDSLVTTNLIVGQSYNLTETITVCENDVVTYPDGSTATITANTVYTSNLLTVNGCDSIIETTVNMNSNYNLVENIVACENSNITYPDGTTEVITANTSYTSSLSTVNGCDSIIVSNVTMMTASDVTENISLCAGEDYTFADGTVHTGIMNNETYVSTFISTNGCDSTITTNITVTAQPAVNAGADQIICEGDQITLSGTGAQAYSWDNGVVDNSPFTPTTTNTYTVTGTDQNGCSSTDQVTITVHSLPTVLFTADVVSGCAPLEVTFTNLSSPTGNNCEWTIGGNTLYGCNTVSETFTSTGTFDVELTVTSANACTSSILIVDYIQVLDAPQANIAADNYTVDSDQSSVQFVNNTTNADFYEWSFGDGMMSNKEEPYYTFPANGNEDYQVTMVASNAYGCADTATVVIKVDDVLIFYVPNTFTPDGDQVNQTFLPVFTSGYDAYDYHLMIFNRWGELVFESYDAAYGWNGHYGDGGLVEDGTYIWKIDFRENMSDKRHEVSGHVNVLK